MDIINKFRNNLNDIIDWRIQELTDINITLSMSKESQNDISKKSFLMRGAIALIYAHFEGAIDRIFLEYVRLLNDLLKSNNLIFNKDTTFILELILYKQRENKNFQKIICDISTLNKLLKIGDIRLESYKEIVIKNIEELREIFKSKSKNIDYLNQIEKFLLNENVENLKIDKNVVNTESNLGFEVLINLLNRFDIPITSDVLIQEIHIKQLLEYRNSIAHGENKFIYEGDNNNISTDIDDVRKKSKIIIILIENIKRLVEDRQKDF